MKTTATNETPARSMPRIEPVRDGGARPLWSVMIPTYEPDRTLFREALESVLAQAPPASEMQIEVIDDCSVMDVAAMVTEIGHGRIVFTRNAVRQGLMANWNVCIQRARGHLLHLLHQDDLVFPGFYRVMGAGMAGNPSAAAGFCRHMYIDADGLWKFMSYIEAERGGLLPDCRRRFAEGVSVQCPAMVVRRDTYERVGGFDVSLPYAADSEMWLRIAQSAAFYFTPQVLAAWRMHAGSASVQFKNSGQHIRDACRVLQLAGEYFPDEVAAVRIAKAKFLGHMGASLRDLAWRGQGGQAWQLIETMWRSDGRSRQTRSALIKLSCAVCVAAVGRRLSPRCWRGADKAGSSLRES